MLDPDKIAYGVIWFVAFLLSTTAHEAAHAWVALRGGDRTAYSLGQVSLSPFPHMQREPFGMLILPWLSYFFNGWMMGWASAPYDPFWAMRNPRKAAWMSLAGPLANFSIAAIAGFFIRFGLATGYFKVGLTFGFMNIVLPAENAPAILEGIATFLSILFSLNIILGAFNLIPLPPLDGFTAIGLLLPDSAAAKLRELQITMGAFQFITMLLAWQLAGFVISPAYAIALNLLFL